MYVVAAAHPLVTYGVEWLLADINGFNDNAPLDDLQGTLKLRLCTP